MKYLLIISILLNIIFLFSLYLILQIGEIKDCDKNIIYQYITYNNLESDIKSGDLLLFSYINYFFITRTFGNPAFSHIGLVVQKNNELYSLEMVNLDWILPGKPKKEDIILVPLKERIKNYHGYIYHSSLLKPLSLKQEETLYNYSKKKYKYLKFKYLYKFFKIFDKNSNIKICSQFIGNILEDLQILPKLNSFKIWDYHRQIINLCDGNTYSQPLQIIPNELLINNSSERKILNYC